MTDPNEDGRQYRHGTLSAYNAGKCHCPHCRRAPLGSPGAFQAHFQLALSRGQPLPGRRLQQLQLSIVMGGPDVLDIPRPAPGGVHDLYRCRA